MALEAAANGDKNKALALEASAQHFLTDRFAGGHQFDKDGLMNASGKPGLLSQGVARIIHNKYNQQGADVTNGNGESWKAYGDGHWASKDNEPNRFQTAKAVYASYAELNTAFDKRPSPDQIKDLKTTDLAANKSVPQFDDKFQKKVEKEGADLSYPELVKQVGPDALSALPPTIERTLIKSGESGRNLVQSWEKNAGSLNPIKAWNWMKDAAGQAWDGVRDAGSGAVDWLKNTAGDAVSGLKAAGSGAWNWLKNAGASGWQGIQDAGGGALNWLKNSGGEAWGGIKDATGGAWDFLKNTADGAWDATKQGGLGGLWGFAKEKGSEAFQGIKDATGGAWDWAKQKGGEALGGIQNAGGQAWDWTKHKGGEAWGGIQNAGGQAWDWAKHKGGEAWGGIQSGWTAAKDLGRAGWDFTKDMGGRAVDWGKETLNNGIAAGKEKLGQAWDGAKQLGRDVTETVGQTWNGAKQTLSNGVNTATEAAKGTWNGAKETLSSGWGWLKKQVAH